MHFSFFSPFYENIKVNGLHKWKVKSASPSSKSWLFQLKLENSPISCNFNGTSAIGGRDLCPFSAVSRRSFRPNTHFVAFFEIYKIQEPLHRSKLNFLQNFDNVLSNFKHILITTLLVILRKCLIFTTENL